MSQRASLPSEGYEPPERIFFEEGIPVVRFFPEHGQTHHDFQFTRLGLPSRLTRELAEGFARATGPAGTRRTYSSAKSAFSLLVTFARVLTKDFPVPTSSNELAPSHLSKMKLVSSSRSHYVAIVHALRLVLRGSENLTSSFRDALFTPMAATKSIDTVSAYANTEVAMIRRAARRSIRGALLRVRASRAEAAEYLSAHEVPLHNHVPRGEKRREYFLAHVVSHGGLPRHANGSLKVAGSGAVMGDLNPTLEETWASVVLLICLTGLNLSTVLDLTTEHVLSSTVSDVPVALVRGLKARRGPRKSELDLAFTGRLRHTTSDDLGTPFGVYQATLELGREMRHRTGDDSLFMAFSYTGRQQTTSGFGYKPLTKNWGIPLAGFSDANGDARLVDVRRIRRWFLERHQRPVTQSSQTLSSLYLARDSSAVSAYQGVVKEALDEEFQRIRIENLRRVITYADREQAVHDPATVAKRFGLDATTLTELLDGGLDTVTSACVDNTESPYSARGEPCSASFLLCLGCPCSRSEPRHIPVQASTLLALQDLKSKIDDDDWQRKFQQPAARLKDLLDLQGADPNAEASRATAEDVTNIRALIEGDLDL